MHQEAPTPKRRSSRRRKLILDVALAHRDHPTVDEIYNEVRRDEPHISRATVYRNLHLLASEGDLSAVSVPGSERFDYRLDPHTHVVCTQCGRVDDAPMAYDPELSSSISAATGYQVVAQQTYFTGICPACQRQVR